MEGQVEVAFTVLCDNDFHKEITLAELIGSEKVLRAIKSEYGEGSRNLQLFASDPKIKLTLGTQKEIYTHTIDKKDIQDILELTEEYARSQKLLKSSCAQVELIDFKTV